MSTQRDLDLNVMLLERTKSPQCKVLWGPRIPHRSEEGGVECYRGVEAITGFYEIQYSSCGLYIFNRTLSYCGLSALLLLLTLLKVGHIL